MAELPRIVREHEACIALIKPKEDRESILAMSASTLDRAFKGLPRIKPFAAKSNRRSGPNGPIPDAIECKSGAKTMACDVRPGDMRGNFFWSLTQTDRNTQWIEITPTWNRGMHNTVETLKRLERRFPFLIASEHEDNGPEFVNYAMAEMQVGRKGMSRVYRKNDNAHVEQKNGAVVRVLFGELRLDCPDLEADRRDQQRQTQKQLLEARLADSALRAAPFWGHPLLRGSRTGPSTSVRNASAPASASFEVSSI